MAIKTFGDTKFGGIFGGLYAPKFVRSGYSIPLLNSCIRGVTEVTPQTFIKPVEMKDFESGCSRFRSPVTERGWMPSDTKSDMKDDMLDVEVGSGKSNC